MRTFLSNLTEDEFFSILIVRAKASLRTNLNRQAARRPKPGGGQAKDAMNCQDRKHHTEIAAGRAALR